MTKDIPIIFSGPMVRALLDGRKTMTRRLAWHGVKASRGFPEGMMRASPWQNVKPGYRLWVRENYAPRYFDGGKHGYAADWSESSADVVPRPKWTPCIHMPRTASRLTLIVTATKIEPLLDISDDDALAEGCKGWDTIGKEIGPARDLGDGWSMQQHGEYVSPAGEFQILWSKLHPDWDGFSSPELVALSFRAVKANIDAPEASGA